jgi:hypothetical protein
MPAGWGFWCGPADRSPREGPLRGKGRGVTKSPKRAKRRNRRRP